MGFKGDFDPKNGSGVVPCSTGAPKCGFWGCKFLNRRILGKGRGYLHIWKPAVGVNVFSLPRKACVTIIIIIIIIIILLLLLFCYYSYYCYYHYHYHYYVLSLLCVFFPGSACLIIPQMPGFLLVQGGASKKTPKSWSANRLQSRHDALHFPCQPNLLLGIQRSDT